MQCYVINGTLHNLMYALEATTFHQYGKAKSGMKTEFCKKI